MANEVKINTLLGKGGDPVEYTVAAGTAIEKGTLMQMTGNGVAIKVAGAGVPIAGVAASSKTATDGITKMACLTNFIGEFATTGGAIPLGEYVRSDAATNTVGPMTSLDFETGKAVGKAMDTGASSTVNVRVKI